jgi:amino acid transporter
MGRANALPKRFFGAVDAKNSIPRNNVLAVGACMLVGVFLMTYGQGAELLNFGAFIAFIGVNAAAFLHYKFRSQEKVFLPALIPLLGMAVCIFIWLNLSHSAQLLGVIWILIGLAIYFIMRRRAPKVSLDSAFE